MYIKGTHCADFHDQGFVYQKVCMVVVFMYRDGVGSKWPPVLKVLKNVTRLLLAKANCMYWSLPTRSNQQSPRMCTWRQASPTTAL